jgi:hypothetical protein
MALESSPEIRGTIQTNMVHGWFMPLQVSPSVNPDKFEAWPHALLVLFLYCLPEVR